MTATTDDDLACQELVELVTDYLEGALAPVTCARFERHLAGCPYCVTYVEQVRATVRLAGAAPVDPVEPEERGRLLAAFRGWRSARD